MQILIIHTQDLNPNTTCYYFIFKTVSQSSRKWNIYYVVRVCKQLLCVICNIYLHVLANKPFTIGTSRTSGCPWDLSWIQIVSWHLWFAEKTWHCHQLFKICRRRHWNEPGKLHVGYSSNWKSISITKGSQLQGFFSFPSYAPVIRYLAVILLVCPSVSLSVNPQNI